MEAMTTMASKVEEEKKKERMRRGNTIRKCLISN